MNFYYVPLFATLFGLITSTNSFTPPNVTLKNSVQIWYCPLDVQATLSPDRASIDLSYTTPQSQQNSLSQQFACFTQLRLDFQAGNNAVTMNEIQYEGGLKSDEGIGEVETRATWSYVPTVENGVNGPTQFTPALLSKTSPTQLVANTTLAVPATCCLCDFVKLNVRTIFNYRGSKEEPHWTLTQRLKLHWHDVCQVKLPVCDILDIDGNPPQQCIGSA